MTLLGRLRGRLGSCRSAATSASSRLLAHEVHGDGNGRTAFILHGLMGAGRNWRTFAKRLRERLGAEKWRIVLVDLRGHGGSAEIGVREGGASGTGTEAVRDAARDVDDLARAVGAPSVVIGHSLGGKVALEYSKLATTAATQVWSLDSVPGKVLGGDVHGVQEVLDAVRRLPARIPSRRWLAGELSPQFSSAMIDWIGSNLRNVDDELEFVWNIDTVRDLYASYRNTDSWESLEVPRSDMFVVKAEKSTRWSPECVERLKSTSTTYMELPRAGHWLHADNPDGLLEFIASANSNNE